MIQLQPSMTDTPWAIDPPRFRVLADQWARAQAAGTDPGPRVQQEGRSTRRSSITQAGIQRAADDQRPYLVDRGVAIIPIEGVIGKVSDGWTDVSTLMIAAAARAAVDDPTVAAILFYVDSPGGTVDGTAELARELFAMRGRKPMVSYTDGMMTSAAYWIGSAADRIVISGDTTKVGSIGVIATHVDISKALGEMGVTVTHITAGKYKAVLSPFTPLSDLGRMTMQEVVDYLYAGFLDAVGGHRGTDAETVHDVMGDARIFIGRQALVAGLVDGEASLTETIRQLSEAQPGHQPWPLMSSKTRLAGLNAALRRRRTSTEG